MKHDPICLHCRSQRSQHLQFGRNLFCRDPLGNVFLTRSFASSVDCRAELAAIVLGIAMAAAGTFAVLVGLGGRHVAELVGATGVAMVTASALSLRWRLR